MMPSNKSVRRALPTNDVYKTADDLIRWRKGRDPQKEELKEEQIVQSDRSISQALMIWDDDGGAAAA